MYGQQVALRRVTMDELVAKLKENPNDAQSISLYQQKLMSEVSPLTRSEPEKAEQMLNAAKELLSSIKEGLEQDAAKAVERIEQSFGRLESSIETGKKLAALVGSDAAPLTVSAWVNGEPLTDGDLKGKIVLLDFWAVWCGPCIATFPHLREWHEMYADKGLVIIGLTRFYKYVWDTETGRPRRAASGETVTPEQELDMLTKFAEHHNLHHRFAIQEDRSLSEFYAVTGIPHVVVIDQEGVVRMIRVGSGEKNANDISELLAKLAASD
jgi:thiol-disulfide isomerase/thioredoxin